MTWREALKGRRVVVTFRTSAELAAGALSSNWSARRTAQLAALLDRTPTIHSDAEVVNAYAALSAECRRAGHGLHDKVHTGDRWVAACAIAKGFDLLSGDAIFQGAPNLVLRS